MAFLGHRDPLSAAAQVANATHAPQVPWFLIGVTKLPAGLVRQSTDLGGAGNASNLEAGASVGEGDRRARHGRIDPDAEEHLAAALLRRGEQAVVGRGPVVAALGKVRA